MKIFILVSIYLQVTFAYKYLIYSPLFGHSHSVFFSHIANSLTSAGHNVTILAPIMDPLLAELKNHPTETKNIFYLEADQRVVQFYDYIRPYAFDLADRPLMMISWVQNFTLCFKYTCENILKNQEILHELKTRNFDVGIAEPLHFCGFGLFEQLKIPAMIAASSFTSHPSSLLVGEPTAPSYVPSIMHTSGEKMSFLNRLTNSAMYALGTFLNPNIFGAEYEEFVKLYGSSASPPEELIPRVSFYFVNSNPYIDYPRPSIHKVIDIGGISVDIKNIRKLDEKWDAVLSERKQTIFISFGTISKAKDMPDNWKKSIVELAKIMPDVTFIWKYEEESSFVEEIPNLYMASWLPQRALLADKRLSLFVTHAGLGSCYEFCYLGKPALMVTFENIFYSLQIPLMGDQSRNAAMLARHGVAFVISRSDLAYPKILKESILKMLNDDSYAKNATKLANLLREQPISPKDLVVSHAEFVAKFGALPQLDPYGRKQSIMQYFLIDILFFSTFLIVILIGLIFFTVKYCWRKCSSKIWKDKTE